MNKYAIYYSQTYEHMRATYVIIGTAYIEATSPKEAKAHFDKTGPSEGTVYITQICTVENL